MDRSAYNAHEGLKAGRPTAQNAAYLEAVERMRLAAERAALKHRLKVAALKALLVANVVVWAAQHARGVL